MKKCKLCGHEINEIVSKTIKIKELNIEVERDVHDKNKSYNEIMKQGIPKGWRLMNYDECIKLANLKYAKELKMDGSSSQDDFFIEQPFNLNKEHNPVAWFRANSDWARLFCYGDPTVSYSGLGVRFVRNFK